MKCEEIIDGKERKFSKHTAQIYRDCLYIYGNGKGKVREFGFPEVTQTELWSFDLSIILILGIIINLLNRK